MADIKYEDLKSILLKKFCPTSSIRVQRIPDLPQHPMSDRTPSQIFPRLKLLNEICLMYLTPQFRSTLVENEICDTSKLVEEAEKRHNAYLTAIHLRPSTLPTSDITAVRTAPHGLVIPHRLLNPSSVDIIYVMSTKLRNA